MNAKYGRLFEGWEIGVAKKIINQYRKEWGCLEREEFDDLLQECLTHWFFAKDQYEYPKNDPPVTLLSVIIKNKLGDLIRQFKSQKRVIIENTLSLDEPLSDKEGAPTVLDSLPVDEEYTSNIRIHAELKIDISRAFQRLTQKQRELCRLLGEEGLSIKEASEVLKKPRGTVYGEIKRIKAIFQKEKLHEYLE